MDGPSSIAFPGILARSCTGCGVANIRITVVTGDGSIVGGSLVNCTTNTDS